MKTGLLFVLYFEIGLLVLAFLLGLFIGLFRIDASSTIEQARVIHSGLQYLIPVVFLYGIWRQRRTAPRSH